MTFKRLILVLIWTATLMVPVVSLFLTREGSVAPAKTGLTSKNIVILVADTLRADHLACYGYRRNTSPHLDDLARRSTRYTHAYAAAPWTLPSHASMFTGKFPFEHGVHTYLADKDDTGDRNAKRQDDDRGRLGEHRLAGRHLTLAEFLSDNGYETGAMVANVSYLAKRWNLHQGFDRYKIRHARAKRLNEDIFDWLDAVGTRRFFLFVNYMDTHRVYNTTPRRGLLDMPVVRDKGELLNKLIYRVMHPSFQKKGFPRDVVRQVIAQYDTAVANVDEAIGKLIAFLKRRGLYDNTMIIVTSDHGEFFGEHHLVEHSKDVYQEALHVPLLVKKPDQKEGAVLSEIVSSVDIPGMVVRGLGRGVQRRGAKVFKRVPGNHRVISENYYSRSKDVFHPAWGHRFRRIRAVLFDYPYKYILSSDGVNELYHLENDKAEARNLLDTNEALGKRYHDILSRQVKTNWFRHKPAGKTILTETEKAQLRELGYLE